jgi:serine protease Do
MPLKFPYKSPFLLVAVALSLVGCGSLVKEVGYAPAPEIGESAKPVPIKFSGLELLLPPGMNVGSSQGGAFCMSPAYPVNRNVLTKEIDRKFLRQGFHDAMEANGYDVTGSLDIIFEPDDEEQRAEYSVAGKLKDLQVNLCHSGSSGLGGALDWATKAPGERGELYAAIDWSVYDRLRRTVVYKTRTEGYTKRRVPNVEGLSLLFHDAFEMATHNLAADEQFRALIVDGVKPPQDHFGRDARGEKMDMREMMFEADEAVHIKAQALSQQPFAKTATEGAKVAVMLQKGGHGSGFFITDQGHILTNAHVIGEARKMRVVAQGRKKGMVAEVLRVNRARDVALLKLEEVPEGLDITTLPIRLDWPRVGEDIYAIGTPKDWKGLRGSVTKGIVSAHRKGFKHEGLRLDFIQGDVEVHPGSSGGPLVDEHGNIVGLSVLSYTHSNESGTQVGIGLNLFIPVGEALDVLDVSYLKKRKKVQGA